jgi:site-specific DNA-methyltransferase (adenine-specific)/modification methylase
MTPYYAGNGVELYLADALELVDSWPREAFLLTDPPYGVGERTDRGSMGRGAAAPEYRRGFGSRSRAIYEAKDFPPIVGDDRPFDPTPFLRFRKVVLFGANNYSARLPASNGWIVWDKLDGLRSVRSKVDGDGFNNNGDAELAWTNVIGAVRILRHRWMGLLKGSEGQERRIHPTQKPVELMARIIRRWSDPSDLIIDPFAGSGSTLVAAIREGRRAIGVEIVEAYCAGAARRLEVTERIRHEARA